MEIQGQRGNGSNQDKIHLPNGNGGTLSGVSSVYKTLPTLAIGDEHNRTAKAAPFLKANPRTAIFLPVIVLNKVLTMRLENRLFWYSFIEVICNQAQPVSRLTLKVMLSGQSQKHT